MRIPTPGAGRITLAALAITAAVMTYPWHTVFERWVLGIAAVVVILLAVWWRGQFLTTVLGRRLAMLRGRTDTGVREPVRFTATDAKTTAALRIVDDTGEQVPLGVIGSYLQRYGVRCEAVRVTTRDTPASRTTWIGVTLSAATNLAALQARSAALPLRETAEIALRRLADHLRELGWTVNTGDLDVPDLFGPQPKERWRGVQDGDHGHLVAYGIAVDDRLDETLRGLWAFTAPEVWTALEVSGAAEHPQLAVACAVRTEDPSLAPVPGLISQAGNQWAAVQALHPLSTEPLAAPRVPVELAPPIEWPAGAVTVRT